MFKMNTGSKLQSVTACEVTIQQQQQHAKAWTVCDPAEWGLINLDWLLALSPNSGRKLHLKGWSLYHVNLGNLNSKHQTILSPKSNDHDKKRASDYLDPTTKIMSQPSLAGYIVKRPWLKRWMMPLANWYANAAGYRKLGLRYAHHWRGRWKLLLDHSDLLRAIFGLEGELCWPLGYYRADDLIPEESEAVLLALKRLPEKEAYDRVFRLRRAFQVDSRHK